MKIALFGNGTTGARVLECADSETEILGPFTRSRLPSVSELRQANAAILFVPGSALPDLLPLLLEAAVPVVCGATGRELSSSEAQQIKERGIPWIQASNFSLGMNLLLILCQTIGAFRPTQEMGSLRIEEHHHSRKLDSPSGSALSMQRAIGMPVQIDSKREGDIIGFHGITLELPSESLQISHNVADRRVFAEGALWAARLLLREKLGAGLHSFPDLVRTYCLEGWNS